MKKLYSVMKFSVTMNDGPRRTLGGIATGCRCASVMTSRDYLLCQLRELAGCATLTAADLGELRWQTKQRVFMGLLAELPEGKEAVMACAQLQMERNRARQKEKANGVLMETSRKSEDQMRVAFYREVGKVLGGMGAAPDLTGPKTLEVDASVCLRAIGFLVARVGTRQHRRLGASELELTGGARRRIAEAGISAVRPHHRRRSLPVPGSEPMGDRKEVMAEKAAAVVDDSADTVDKRITRCRRNSGNSFSLSTTEARTVEAPFGAPGENTSFEVVVGSQREYSDTIGGRSRRRPQWVSELTTENDGDDSDVFGECFHVVDATVVADVDSAGSQEDNEARKGEQEADGGVQGGERQSRNPADFQNKNDRHGWNSYDETGRDNETSINPLESRTTGSGRSSRSRSAAVSEQKLKTVPARVSIANSNGKSTSGRLLDTWNDDSEKTEEASYNRPMTTVSSGRSESAGRLGTAPAYIGRRRRDSRPDAEDKQLAKVNRHALREHRRGRGDGGADGRGDGFRSCSSRDIPPPPWDHGDQQRPSGWQRGSRVGVRGGHRSPSNPPGNGSVTAAAGIGGGVDGRDAIGLEMGTLDSVWFDRRTPGRGGNTPRQHERGQVDERFSSLSAADVDALQVENARLRERLEELQGLVDTITSPELQSFQTAAPTPATRTAARATRREGAGGGKRASLDEAPLATAAIGVGAGASVSDSILRGQVAQLRRQVRLQWCAVDASAAVTQEVKAVLGHLEATLLEICSLGKTQDGDAPALVFGGGPYSGESRSTRRSSMSVDVGVGGAVALPTWLQVLDRVRKLSRELQCTERAAQRAADGRLHVTKESASYLKFRRDDHVRGQRRPRDLRMRVFDPDHFTCPAPAHGTFHQQQAGTAPVEGQASVILETSTPFSCGSVSKTYEGHYGYYDNVAAWEAKCHEDGSTGKKRGVTVGERASVLSGEDKRSSTAAAAAAATTAENSATSSFRNIVDSREHSQPASSALSGMHELYHLDAVSLDCFGHAATSAMRALEALLRQVAGEAVCDTCGNASCASSASLLPPPGVASLLRRTHCGSDRADGGGACGKRVIELIADVRDSFVDLTIAAAALGVVVPCSPEGAGAASGDSSSPSLRLLSGVKAAGGGDGARRLAALARRLPAERAALEAAAAASASETRAWRAAAKEQASAITALGQGLRGAWNSHIRRTSSLSRPLTAVLGTLRQLLCSPESAKILRGAAGAGAAALLQTLALFEPELEDARAGISSHARRCEEEVSRLWEAFEVACWRAGGMKVGQGAEGLAGVQDEDRESEKKLSDGTARVSSVGSASVVGDSGEGGALGMKANPGGEKWGGESGFKKSVRSQWVD